MAPLILINPHAAGGRARQLLQPIRAWIRALPPNCDTPQILAPETIDAALDILAQIPPQTRVVVVGGDGSLNRILSGLLQGGHIVGLVPFGSGNDCARAWGLHQMSWQQALTHALHASSRKVASK